MGKTKNMLVLLMATMMMIVASTSFATAADRLDGTRASGGGENIKRFLSKRHTASSFGNSLTSKASESEGGKKRVRSRRSWTSPRTRSSFLEECCQEESGTMSGIRRLETDGIGCSPEEQTETADEHGGQWVADTLCDAYFIKKEEKCNCKKNAEYCNKELFCHHLGHCQTNPCQNGGKCVEQLQDYRCICQPEWQGKTCLERTPECCLSSDCSDYRGRIAKTETGRDCQPWNSENPHKKEPALKSEMDSGVLPLLTENFCRNAEGHTTAWCYTMDENTRWENCKIPRCSDIPFTFDLALGTCNQEDSGSSARVSIRLYDDDGGVCQVDNINNEYISGNTEHIYTQLGCREKLGQIVAAAFIGQRKFTDRLCLDNVTVTTREGSFAWQNNGEDFWVAETWKTLRLDKDDCATNPCLNDGNCVDRLDGFFCECQDGWEGVNCGSKPLEPTPELPLRLIDIHGEEIDGIKSWGLVQVFFDRQWGTVCDDYLEDDEKMQQQVGDVICRQLGNPNGGRVQRYWWEWGTKWRKSAELDLKNTPIWLNHIECNGEEARLEECDNAGIGVSPANCDKHREDIYLLCNGERDSDSDSDSNRPF